MDTNLSLIRLKQKNSQSSFGAFPTQHKLPGTEQGIEEWPSENKLSIIYKKYPNYHQLKYLLQICSTVFAAIYWRP